MGTKYKNTLPRSKCNSDYIRIMTELLDSPFKHPFWAAFSGIGPSMKTKDEWLIIDASYALRQKEKWVLKYGDPAIAEKWKSELRNQLSGKTNHVEEIIEYTWKELSWYADIEKNGIHPTFNEMIVCNEISDHLLKERLQEQSEKLRASFSELDYHPNSGNTVVDLVHPSLFPVQYGKTVITRGEPHVINFSESVVAKKKFVDDYGISKTYQWIPSLLTNNDKFSFSSYINNLDPLKFKDLYQTIEDVFNATIPGINYVLSRYASEEYIRNPIGHFDQVYGDGYQEKLEKLEEILDEDDPNAYEKYDEDYRKLKEQCLKLYPPKFENGPPVNRAIDVRNFKNLKVIVKMANIELTPENPLYAGGSWHVEGTINEDIVATVLYYYDVENITESKISFRSMFEDPPYEQGDSLYCQHFFGLEDEDTIVKYLGGISTEENKVVIFPNFFQHHVDLFQLKNKTRPGHRKILCFFLVDPYNDKVLTTAEVPPQQESWWKLEQSINSIIPDLELRTALKKITKLQGLQEAKDVREKLIQERVSAVKDLDEWDMANYERKFLLCEH